MEPSIESQLDQLFENRYHGAVNIAGIKYQLTYTVFRAFDLYKSDASNSIQLEGIEDVDVRKGHKQVELRGISVSSQYVQIKTSKKAWDWGKFASSGIIQNFLPVLSADQEAMLLVVTNFGHSGTLDEFVKFCRGDRRHVSNKVKCNLRNLCKRAGYPDIDLEELIKHISFDHIADRELMKKVTAAIVTGFDLTTSNADLYFCVLMSRFIDFATKRARVQRSDLESIRLFVHDQMDLGSTNLAVQNGWIERLTFVEEAHPDDYYEGKNARPGHILADLDVRRPDWECRVHEALQRSRVCIVRASSGQGKSTLLYRYAHEHYHPETTFVIKRLSDETMVGPVKQAIMTRQRLGLPILVCIDNIGAGLQFWHRLVSEFAGQEVRFLVTIREEDWYRYSGSASGFVWEVVTPALSLAEARTIFAHFQKKGKVANGVISGEWAFEQVADRQLLIEFTYLITHGHMLAVRLNDQVQEMQHLGEDQAKVQVLRLVSVAQTYGAGVTIDAILQCVRFERDPDSTLRSLEREYLLFADGICEGLHFVRSQHLVPLLHSIIPVEHTMAELVKILTPDDLQSFIGNTFADFTVNHAILLETLVERCQHEPFNVIIGSTKALFTASETAYYRQHKRLFDSAFDQVGASGIFLLCAATLPFQTVNILDNMKKVLGAEHPNLSFFSDLARQFTPRQWTTRFDVKFLQAIVYSITPDRLIADFSLIGPLFRWCRLAGLDLSPLLHKLTDRDWQEQMYQADVASTGNFLFVLHEYARNSYDRFLATDKTELVSYFKLVSDTLLVKERDGDIYIEFIVDETEGHANPNDQAVERLRYLRMFFPDYDNYCSQGLYPPMLSLQPPVDDTKKAISNETLKLEIDAEKNATYLKTVESHYTAQSVYEWQYQWVVLRRELLDFAEQCTGFYEDLFYGRKPDVDILNTALRNFLLHAHRLKRLPVVLAERFKGEQGMLMQHNLKDAIKKMPNAQRVFHRIISETLSYFDPSDLDDKEALVYPYLADILDFWFERPPGKVHNLRSAIEKRRQKQRRQFADDVRTTLIPLENQGFSFVYPTAPLLDHPLMGLVLGFEIEDFENTISQMCLIVEQLASFPRECHFAYLLPLLKGAFCIPTVWRIGFAQLRDIAEGNLEGKEWALLPLEPSQPLFEVLPGVQQTSLGEAYLVSEFYRIYGTLNTVRNTMYLVRNRIESNQRFEAQLAEKYRCSLQPELGRISTEVSKLLEQMRKFADDNPSASEWLEFCRACFKRVEDINNIEIADHDPASALQSMELQVLLGRYLNARYLCNSVGM